MQIFRMHSSTSLLYVKRLYSANWYRFTTTALLLLSTQRVVCFSSSLGRPFARIDRALRSTSNPTLVVDTDNSRKIKSDVQEAMSAAAKLDALRKRLQELDLDAYLVPSDDPHLSEYTPDAYKRRAFLTDFHGSAGTALVTPAQALLWTDSRYVEASCACPEYRFREPKSIFHIQIL
jgi:hypothetical protein